MNADASVPWGRYKESEKKPGAADAIRTGFFSPDCSTMTMSDGSVITRINSMAPTGADIVHSGAAPAGDGCEAARLQHTKVGAATASELRRGWWQQTVSYLLARPGGGGGGVGEGVGVWVVGLFGGVGLWRV